MDAETEPKCEDGDSASDTRASDTREETWRVETTPAIHSTSPRRGLEHAQRKAKAFFPGRTPGVKK